jgi:inositol phosphorylceramide synthase catalytic subunit
MSRLREHLRSLGPTWAHLTVIPLMIYSAYIVLGRGEYRWEMIALFFIPPLLGFYSLRTRRLYDGMYPMWLTATLYDSMRFARNFGVTTERVHICDLRQHELDLFGITSHGVKMTLQDYFLAHSSPIADLYFAVPYGTFIYVSVAFATYLYFKDYVALKRYTWTFFLMNIAAYVTYHVYPAAPPWYYHAHGCVADLTAHASEGTHLAAVDAMLGFNYFSSFYGRSADVFGAVPSLHVAYPLLIVLEGWRNFRTLGRGVALLFWASMICAAVYLDHHWVIDVVLGLGYALSLHLLSRVLFGRGATQQQAHSLPAVPA